MSDPIKHGSPEDPIQNPEVRVAKNQYITWEYDHIGRMIGYFKRGKQALVSAKKGDEVRMIDELRVTEPNGQEHVFYFDVTAQVLAKGNAVAPAAKA